MGQGGTGTFASARYWRILRSIACAENRMRDVRLGIRVLLHCSLRRVVDVHVPDEHRRNELARQAGIRLQQLAP